MPDVIYCGVDVPDFELDECVNEPGRIIALALIRCDSQLVDPTSETEWNTEIAAERAIIIKNFRGGYPGPTFTEADGFGRNTTRNTGMQHELSGQHQNVCANVDFYNALNKSEIYRIGFVTSGDSLFIASNNAQIQSGFVVEEGLDTQVVWNFVAKWSENDLPICYDAPPNIFE